MNMDEVKKARDKAGAAIVEALRELSLVTGMRVAVVMIDKRDDGGLPTAMEIELKVPK